MKNITKILLLVIMAVPFLSIFPRNVEAVVQFRRPLTTTLSPAFSAWYDQNSTVGATKKYECSTGTPYDGHKGTDLRANTGTTIYAGANGGLYYRYDGCATTGSAGCGGGFGNHARIDHEGTPDGASGMVSVSAHMKQGTVIGLSSLLCGAQIGQTGASGDVSGPHLHFELRPSGFGSSARIDPFAGSCSQSTSYWTSVNSSGLPGTSCQ